MRCGPDRSSPVSADSTLPSMLRLALSLFGCASPTRTPDGSSSGTGLECLSCPTCGSSTPEPQGLTCCTAGSHVKTFPSPEGDSASSATDPLSGSPTLTRFARFVHDSSSSRTSPASSPRWADVQGSLLSGPSSPIWPKRGTWDLGSAFEPPTSGRPTDASASSSLLGTPRANPSGGPSDVTLTDAIVRTSLGTKPNPRLLPTPRAAASRTSRTAATRQDSRSAPSLEQAIEIAQGILPRELQSIDEVPKSWTGASTNPRFGNGSTSPEPSRPDQLTIEDA